MVSSRCIPREDARRLCLVLILLWQVGTAWANPPASEPDFGPRSFSRRTQGFLWSCAEGLKALVIRGLTKNFSRRTVRFPAGPNETHGPFRVRLGERLGYGTVAQVYDVRSVRDRRGRRVRHFENRGERRSGRWDPGLVIKMGHRFRHPGDEVGAAFPGSGSGIEVEHEIYATLRRALTKIESDPQYPSDPAWGRGRMPVVPIVAATRSPEYGLMLLKLKVRGRSLADIYRKYRPQSPADLPAEMRQSLLDIYQFAQSTYSQVRVPYRFRLGVRRAPGLQEPLSLDITPVNLIWVEDPALLKLLGYRRPGFVAFEFGLMPPMWFHHSRKSATEYLWDTVHFINTQQ